MGVRSATVVLPDTTWPPNPGQLLSVEQRYRMGAPPRKPSAHDDSFADGVQVELLLYVSAGSPACARALATLRALMLEFPANCLRLTVLDVAEHVEAATRDRVLFTPTLLCGAHPPYVRVLGDLTNRSVLLEVLGMATLGGP